MTINVPLAGLMIVAVANLVMIAAAWGDMRRQISDNREMQDRWQRGHERRDDDRHTENRFTLKEIRDDVKRINGSVAEHSTELRNQRNEIDRLRDGQ